MPELSMAGDLLTATFTQILKLQACEHGEMEKEWWGIGEKEGCTGRGMGGTALTSSTEPIDSDYNGPPPIIQLRAPDQRTRRAHS
jgi:hypothetical protein